MAGLFLIRSDDPSFADPAREQARAQFARHGFAGGTEHALPGWHLSHWPQILGGPESLLVDGDDLVAIAGTITVDGLMGRAALARLLAIATLPELDWSRIGGQFVALVRRQGRSFLFADYFATFQLFHDLDHRLFSTSFLAAAQSLPAVRFDPQGLYEFAFNSAVLGDDTVLAELKVLGPRRIVELTAQGVTLHSVAKPLAREPARDSLDRIATHKAKLAAIVAPHVRHFGDHVHCPLSGGLDSRLLLAALRAEGCTPDIYVYGNASSEDVRISREIGQAQGFPVTWIDKHRAPIEPDAFPEMVERNFQENDALPNYGNIFDNGGNAAARDARHAGGGLAASGGCGEVYRDFFFLANRPFGADAIARTFFARFLASDTTAMFDSAAHLAAIRDKILDALELPRSTRAIPRQMVEQVYPRFRCRALFGREISIEARYGAYLMPFLDHQLVAAAMALPIPVKRAGAFESALLNAIDPALAEQPSAYGHDFAGPPSRRHRFDEWATRVRPTWLRQHSYAIHRRLRPMSDEHGGILSREYLGRVLDPDLPAMRRYFEVDRITDVALLRHVVCLEYLAQHLGSRLVD